MARISRSGGGEPFEVRKVRLPQEADGELDGFTESSTESFFVFDENLNCVGINPAGQELLDVSEQTAVGKNIAGIIPGAEDRRVYQEYLDVVKTEERLVTRAEYGERQLGIKAFKVGNGLGIIASDITERRLAEDDLQRSEEHWQGLFSSLEDATVMIDKDYNIENLNDSGLARVGKSREEVVGEKCYRIICGSESPHELCLLGKAVETGRPQSTDREVFGREVSVRITPLQDKNGEIMKLVETVKEVGRSTRATEETARVGATALSVDDAAMADLEGNLLDEIGEDVAGELRRANERIEREVAERERAERELMIKDSALELSLSGFALFDSEKALTHVNRSFLRMWGYDEEAEILGRPFAGLWQSSQGASEVVAAVSSLGGWEGDLVALGKDGSTFDAELSACMIVDEESGHICMVASIVDVTARKRAEEELSRHQGRLDSREDEHATELKYVDDRLQQEVGGRRHAQEELNGLRTHGDELVEKRTAELASANEQLEAEIAERKFAQDELNQRCSRLEQEADAQAAELRGTTQRLEEETAARRGAEEESKKLRDHFEEVLEERAAELKKANQQLEQEKAELVKAIGGSGGPDRQLGEAEEGTPAGPGKASEQLQEELRVRESAMALLVDAIVTAQADGKLTYVNQSFLEMWRFDSDAEVLGEPFAGLWQSEDQAQTVLETLLGGEGWKGELAARRKDDSAFEVELSASMVTDENDRNICVVASIVDLTERRQVEEKLKEFERKFSVLAGKSVEWAERLSGVLKELQEPAGELAEATDAEDVETVDTEEDDEARGEAETTVEDASPAVAEAEDGEPVDAEDLEEGAGPVEAEDAGVVDAEGLGTTEATDREVVEAEDIEEAGETIGEGPEAVQIVIEASVEGENAETAGAEAVGITDPERNEAASDEGSGETASVNSGLIDIKIDEDS